MDADRYCVQTDAQTTEKYKPLSSIVGFKTPVDNMCELALPQAATSSSRFRGIQIVFSRNGLTVKEHCIRCDSIVCVDI
eukprot:5460640-Amphidinium_carterae.1